MYAARCSNHLDIGNLLVWQKAGYRLLRYDRPLTNPYLFVVIFIPKIELTLHNIYRIF